MAMQMRKELEIYGCDWDPDVFEDLLQDLFCSMCIAMSMEEFLADRKDLAEYCDQVCQRIGKRIPDRVIVRRLINVRKSGRLAA